MQCHRAVRRGLQVGARHVRVSDGASCRHAAVLLPGRRWHRQRPHLGELRPLHQVLQAEDAVFNPRKSSSYRTLPCTSNLCKAFSGGACRAGSSCEYHYAYQDGSNIDGVLATDDLTFDSSAGSPLVFSNIAFGCNSQSSGSFSSRTAGLAGLGGGPVSLVSQIVRSLDKKYFSYCLVPKSDTQASSKVIFGSAGVVAGSTVTTPMTVEGAFFVLRLEEIIVDGAGSVPVPPSARGLKTGNIIIDSSTTLNYFPADVISSLVQQVST
ncbi:hypothetical protein ZIOFF_009220 [Zingiber officinale]|uniref:Peptidase A1 domain-containing protein n=1 Tax=Zingiber officinale TaxID=94328 RepID=A0A8J5HTN6_ZINOF|nr:hypothetical protein ZIOFF_009220 [Zingiber officinale]